MIKAENIKRIVTAVLLAVVTVAAILLLESVLFSIVVGLIAVAAAWEWCQLGGTRDSLGWNIAFISLVGAGVPSFLIFPPALPWVLGIALFWWTSTAVLIGLGGWWSQTPRWKAKKWHAVLVIFPAAVAITGLHAKGSGGVWYVLACLLIVWTTDTCAYMVGRVFGKTLLAPGISPAKTVEGATGGVVGASIVGLILYEVLPIEMISPRLYRPPTTVPVSAYRDIPAGPWFRCSVRSSWQRRGPCDTGWSKHISVVCYRSAAWHDRGPLPCRTT